MLYHVRIHEIDQVIRCRIENYERFSDLSKKIRDLLLSETHYQFTLYGSTQNECDNISESAPEGTTFTLFSFSTKINLKFELFFHPKNLPNHYILYSTISMKTMIEGDQFFLDENKNCKELKVIIRDFLANRYKIDRTKQIHLFLTGGCPFTHGTIKEYKKTQYKQKYQNRFYVIITKKISEKLLDSDIPNVCNIKNKG